MARNEIGDEGAIALAEALTNGNLKNLTSLDVIPIFVIGKTNGTRYKFA